MLNFNHLRTFYEVAKLENVRAASEKLFISQPAVSKQIKSLEDFCGTNLFKRQGRRIVLSDFGRMLMNKCSAIFDLERDIENFIKAFRDLKIGVLKVGTAREFAQFTLAEHIRKFHSLYPGITFSLEEANSKEIAMRLLRLENEIGIISRVPELKQLEFIPFFTEKIVLFASPKHPLTTKEQGINFHDLKGQPLVLKPKQSGTRAALDKTFCRHGFKPHIFIETSNPECIKQIVDQGDCLAFMALSSLIHEFQKGRFRMIPIINEEINMDVTVAYLRDQPLSPSAKAFIKLLLDNPPQAKSFSVYANKK